MAAYLANAFGADWLNRGIPRVPASRAPDPNTPVRALAARVSPRTQPELPPERDVSGTVTQTEG